MIKLSKKSLDKLIRSGWNNKTRADVSGIVEQMKKDGFEPPFHLVQFLEQFYGVTIENGDAFVIEYTRFSKDSCKLLESEIGKNVFPIGDIRYSEFLLVVDESGCFYAARPSEIYCIGLDYTEGIEFLCNRSLKEWNLKAIS
ncbi:MAG: SUKH-3 domain-containing protein [Colwellia sp.]|nr:SUKH-3 domain-containing protein [Colwellia sp.]